MSIRAMFAYYWDSKARHIEKVWGYAQNSIRAIHERHLLKRRYTGIGKGFKKNTKVD